LEEIMQVFIAAVSLALIVSFLCSIFESVLLSINHAQVEALVQQGKRTGRLLKEFKHHIDMPIAAILITNTIAHTVGTAVAGATYQDVFSAETLWIFTIVFTTAVLLLTEIIPKTLGVTHARRLAMPVAYGINALAVALHPLVLLSGSVSRWLRGGKDAPVTSVEEIRLRDATEETGRLSVGRFKPPAGAKNIETIRAQSFSIFNHKSAGPGLRRRHGEGIAVAVTGRSG
jgi:CBS domain containing-hemolysin-like protein